MLINDFLLFCFLAKIAPQYINKGIWPSDILQNYSLVYTSVKGKLIIINVSDVSDVSDLPVFLSSSMLIKLNFLILLVV